MDVTAANYTLLLPEFKRLLAECEFYAIDQEMTGISTSAESEHFGMDVGEAYGPKRTAATRYCAFQLGVSLFTRVAGGVDAKPKYEARSFNFWLRPSDDRQDVILNISAIKFLLKNHMDFQKWLTCGMPFATAALEETEMENATPKDTYDDISESDRLWVDKMETRILEWYRGTDEALASAQSATTEVSSSDAVAQEQQQQLQLPVPTKTLELTEPHVHWKVDVALHHRLARHVDVVVVVDPPLDNRMPSYQRKKTVVTRCTPAEATAARSAEVSRRLDDVSAKVGFRPYFSALVASGKPHVGHNYFSDLLFAMHQHDSVLPMSYTAFKERVHSLFPILYDTKTLAAQVVGPDMKPFPNTALEPLFKDVVARWGGDVEIVFPMGFEAYHPKCLSKQEMSGTAAVAHQAAFDAYMTGVVFIHLSRQLCSARLETVKNMISVFGSHYCANFAQGEEGAPSADLMLQRACFCLQILAPKLVTRDMVTSWMLTPAQRAQLDAAPESKRGALSFSIRDFHIAVMDPPLSNKEMTQIIVALFPPNDVTSLSLDDVFQRVSDGMKRNDSAFDFRVMKFSDWIQHRKNALHDVLMKRSRNDE